MQVPLKIDFESLEPSAALKERIRRHAARLERFSPRLIGCHVVVREPHRHHRQGRQFEVRIHLTLPGGEIAVSHVPAGRFHEDPALAVRDAFLQARRQLEDFVRVRRGDVKAHSRPARAARARRAS